MMPILAWLLRVLVVLFLFRVIFRLLTSGVRTVPQGPRSSPGPPGPPSTSGGTLVRDPQCGTYVLESRAIAIVRGSERVFFCSAACRDAWTATHA